MSRGMPGPSNRTSATPVSSHDDSMPRTFIEPVRVGTLSAGLVPALAGAPRPRAQAARGSVLFLRVVDRVLRNLDRHVLLRQDRLTREPGRGLEAPRAVEQILLALVGL